MSKQIHDGESDRRKQVKFRAGAELVERFDALVETSEEYSNRSDALRAAMRRMLGNGDEHAAPLAPPTDDELREAYLTLVGLSNYAGVVPHDIATSELSTRLAKSQEVVERRVLGKLRSRGYLQQLTNVQGTERAWKLRGLDR
jgi:Arc/MetJ-type ribon-helix-helix transcriptional regulator